MPLRRPLFVCSLALGAAALLMLGCSDSPTEPEASDYRIAYAFTPDNSRPSMHIWLATADGSQRRQLDTIPSFSIGDPAWSPDGGQVVFTRDTTYNAAPNEVVIMNLDGSIARRFWHPTGGYYRPSFTPDGTRLLATAFEPTRARVVLVNVDGSGLAAVAGTDSVYGGAVMSPDGTRILFDCKYAVCEVPAQGGVARTVISAGSSATFSPDGNSVAYLTRDGIHVADSRTWTSRLVVALRGGGLYIPLAWSSDGLELTFVGSPVGYGAPGSALTAFGDLYVVPAQGGTARNITAFPFNAFATSPAWAPAR